MSLSRRHSGASTPLAHLGRVRLAPLSLAVALFAGGAAEAASPAHARVSLVRSAVMLDGVVQLDPPEGGPPGAAWRVTPISLLQSFEVRFEFSLAAGTRSPPQADGVALVIQTNGTDAIGEGGGWIGYGGLNGVASVVQTYENNHIGLNLDSNPYHTKAAPADLGAAQLVEGEELVKYDAVAHVFSMKGRIIVDGVSYSVEDTKDVDLATLLASDTATIGVTGGSGSFTADQRIVSWSFHYLH
jgi:hypothetical protein